MLTEAVGDAGGKLMSFSDKGPWFSADSTDWPIPRRNNPPAGQCLLVKTLFPDAGKKEVHKLADDHAAVWK